MLIAGLQATVLSEGVGLSSVGHGDRGDCFAGGSGDLCPGIRLLLVGLPPGPLRR